MVHRQIQDHTDSPVMAGCQQLLKIFQGTILRIDVLIICSVVFMIGRGGHHRHEPDAVDSQIRIRGIISVIQIIQLFQHSLQITDAVTVTVIKGINKKLVVGAVVVIRDL